MGFSFEALQLRVLLSGGALHALAGCILAVAIGLPMMAPAHAQASSASRKPLAGTVLDPRGAPARGARITLAPAGGTGKSYVATSGLDGRFVFPDVSQGWYGIAVRLPRHPPTTQRIFMVKGIPLLLAVTAGNSLSIVVQPPISAPGQANGRRGVSGVADAAGATGGENLSSQSVSELPLNGRDFSTLLLLAAGTMTDVNGATNFTQQFAVNGQRGVEAVFAMDGADITDPEMGGSAFTNFNVDAIQDLQSKSGWMPAEIGRGAAGFTNIVTRSGKSGFHGSLFEFLRNSALDARNYFDHPSIADPGRIPPFRRNEFGFTNGGPVMLPHVYDGRGRTFYFGEYQGFRQVLGTTQVLAVPTAAERSGRDTVTFPDGVTDTLLVPVNPGIGRELARFPLPNDPRGAFGARTYAAASNVNTDQDQFSIRIDQKLGEKGQFMSRFTYDNLNGPTTNPDQTLLDPTFGVAYTDHQRNVVFTYSHTASPRYLWSASFSITRTTPSFPTLNHTDPALKFTDGLFEPFNAAAGSVMSSFGNLFQGQLDFSWTSGSHAAKWGVEARLNRDTTYFGVSPNGEYDFGGGTVYSPALIPSADGLHNIEPGDPLPDTLSSLLLGYPYSYTVAVAPPEFSNGAHIGPAAINRNDINAYVQDTWKINDRWALDYGLRYELYTPITERASRTAGFLNPYPAPGSGQKYLINPRPTYRSGWNGLAPRVQIDWKSPGKILVHAGGALTTIPPNIWQDNLLTGTTPFVVYPRINAARGGEITFGYQITPSELPQAYTPQGEPILASGDPKKVSANTVMDVNRYQQDLAALAPGHQLSLLSLSAIDPRFGNGILDTWTMGLERSFGAVTADIGYVGTEASHLPRMSYPNAYPGADPGFAPFTDFSSTGTVSGGFGFETVVTNNAHSSYNSLQTSLSGRLGSGGPFLQASYTFGKSLDDVSGLQGGTGSAGAVVVFSPQNPLDTRAEKGPSNFDVTHALTISANQAFRMGRLRLLPPAARLLTNGWDLLTISTMTSGSPFTVYSGMQQTGFGTIGADRPDQIGEPQLSTDHSSTRRREDYFGRGPENASFFSIPIDIPGGSGPNSGRFGTLGRNSFRGPAYYDFDFSLIKTTPIGRRRSGMEGADLQFRAEFFNLFNIVNMGLPANTVKGSGLGVISKTAGTSRQIQFALKLIY